jgi:hypothetical protein
MSFRTVEVELDCGRVRPRNAESLPDKARALLTILSPTSVESLSTDGLSLAELAGDFVGIGDGTHTDLSTNKAHLDDFGR